MRPLHELNGDGRWTYTLLVDYAIDFKFNARVVRLTDEPPEIADFDSDVPWAPTVSLDTHFFRITPSDHIRWHGVFFWGLHLAQPFPAPLPHETKGARAGYLGT